MKKKKEYKMVDIFAGCVGLSCGLEQARFTPWFVNEIVDTFCNTYKVSYIRLRKSNRISRTALGTNTNLTTK